MCVMIDCRRQKRWRMASPGTSKTWLNSTGELIGLCFMTSSSLFVSRDDNGNLFESRGSTTVVMPNATTLDNLPSLQQQPCNPICNASDFFDCLSQGSWGKFHDVHIADVCCLPPNSIAYVVWPVKGCQREFPDDFDVVIWYVVSKWHIRRCYGCCLCKIPEKNTQHNLCNPSSL